MRRVKQVIIGVVLAGSLLIGGCAAPQPEESTVKLDPANPVQVDVWTYYNGKQQQAFEGLVADFNASKGRDLGVVVSHAAQGGVNDLATAVTASANEMVGSELLPEIFLSYADTAFAVDQMGKVADLKGYLSDEEKSAFVEGFLAEGDIDGTGSLKVFPVSKATESLQINATGWSVFAEATGATLDELSTVEGVTEVAQRYYEWSDAQTTTPDDGRPFFGRDSLANYLLTGAAQLGYPLLSVTKGVGTVEIDKPTMRVLWDNFYVPSINGYFSSEGRFRSDAIKTGDLICYNGSSSAVVYFPSAITISDQSSSPIDLEVLENLRFREGTLCAPLQGAGFVVSKSDARTETACAEFLIWLTEKERNTAFAIQAGYIPVTKEACTYEYIESVALSMDEASSNYLRSLPATLATIEAGVYTSAPFEKGVDARFVLENSLADKTVADRDAVLAAMQQGISRADAVAAFDTDANFEAWLASFSSSLKTAISSN